MNIIKRGFCRIKSAFWRESGFSWGRLSILSALVVAGSIGLTFMPLPQFAQDAGFYLVSAVLGTFIISLLVWICKIVSGTKFVKASLAKGGGPVFFLLFLNLVLGVYLAATAPIAAKYQRQMVLYAERIATANDKFNTMADGKGMNVVMVGTLIKKSDKADPVRLKKAKSELRLFSAPDGRLRWIGWLNDYPDLAHAWRAEEEARALHNRAGSTFDDITSLRDPIKWLTGFCLCWMCLKLVLLLRKNTPRSIKTGPGCFRV